MTSYVSAVFLLLLVVSLLGVGCHANRPIEPRSKGSPWPMPRLMRTAPTLMPVNTVDFQFINVGVDCDILTAAFKRYNLVIFGGEVARSDAGHMGSDALSSLTVNATSCDKMPHEKMNENYTLHVMPDTSSLSAPEVWGVLRGLETFVQLMYKSETGQVVVNQTYIEDFPRFGHREILIDTARHFIHMEFLYKNLDVMTMNKFNVFHWHITDDQSFPYVSVKFPQLSAMGAYKPNHVYTPEDVQDIIEYARMRGIRVMVEFDTPGHSLSWGKGQKGILTQCAGGGYGPMDPSLNFTYQFLAEFFEEVAQVFPEHYIHMGGDEVPFGCWQSNTEITAFMKKMGYTQYYQLEQYYMQKLLNIVSGLKKGYMIWQEVIDNGATVANDTIVNVWKPHWQDDIAKVTSKGYYTILSACWYLDLISYGQRQDWKGYYNCDPHGFTGSDAQKNLVIGGAAALWAEFMDGTNLIPRLWPRASAPAERLWSDASLNNANAAIPRMTEHRCRMVARGYEAQPVVGPGYCEVEY